MKSPIRLAMALDRKMGLLIRGERDSHFAVCVMENANTSLLQFCKLR